MNITNEAKIILENLLKEENKDCLTIEIINNGSQNALSLDFINMETAPYTINDVKVFMSEETNEILSNVTIDSHDGNLIFRSSCSCSGGCDGNNCCHDDSDCCGGCN